MKVKAISLIETTVAMNLISLCVMLIMIAFIKIDNYSVKKQQLICLITIENVESEIRVSDKSIEEIIVQTNVEIEKFGIQVFYNLEVRNQLAYIRLRLQDFNDKEVFSKKIITQNKYY